MTGHYRPLTLSQLIQDFDREVTELRQDKELTYEKVTGKTLELLAKTGESLRELAQKPENMDQIISIQTQIGEILDGLKEIKAGLVVQTANENLEREALTKIIAYLDNAGPTT